MYTFSLQQQLNITPKSIIPAGNPGQKTTGQKTTEQKTTKNANPGQKTTRTKDHPDKRPPSWFFYGEILSHLSVYSFIRERVKKMTKMTLSVFVAV